MKTVPSRSADSKEVPDALAPVKSAPCKGTLKHASGFTRDHRERGKERRECQSTNFEICFEEACSSNLGSLKFSLTSAKDVQIPR